MGTLSPPSPAGAATSCEQIGRLSFPDATISAAESVPAGTFTPPAARRAATAPGPSRAFAQLPPFCRIALTSRPTSDSDINIEVWLPAAGWNGKLQAVGDGGLAGSIPYNLMATALREGYAAAGTDTGHVGGNADFMPGHPEKLVDFAHRSTHQMAVTAKAVIEAFYDRRPASSYYNACSGGGRHAVTSAQRYPDDFQGIVAGAASWDQARLDAARIGIKLLVNRTPETQIPASKYPMVHRAVIQACDAADGVTDGIIENPRACSFDYATLACKAGDEPSCLTPPQVESARALTSPFRDPAAGKVLLESHLRPGTELAWGILGGPEPITSSLSRVRNFHLKDPAWEPRLESIGADLERAVRMDGGLIASNNFNLRPFFERGGKLLMWHGWSDPQVPADHSVLYHDGVRKTVGAAADQSIALFMLPGVGHCAGGDGPDTFDRMAAIADWVEHGRKPSRIVASRVRDGRVDLTRPLCPFPQVAKYNGTGDTNSAESFSCVVPPGR
jgi:feruloyl esterase